MKPWVKMTNDEMAMHLEFWVALEDRLTESQVKFFEEILFRLRLSKEKYG